MKKTQEEIDDMQGGRRGEDQVRLDKPQKLKKTLSSNEESTRRSRRIEDYWHRNKTKKFIEGCIELKNK